MLGAGTDRGVVATRLRGCTRSTQPTLRDRSDDPRRPHRLADTQKDDRGLTAEMKPDTATERLLFQRNMTTGTASSADKALFAQRGPYLADRLTPMKGNP